MSAEHFISAVSKRRKLYFAEVLLVGVMYKEDEQRKPKWQAWHLLLMTSDLETWQKWN